MLFLVINNFRYTEAMFLNDKLNSSVNGPKSRIGTDTRDMIVRGITGSLNTISRHIANEMKTYRPPPAGNYFFLYSMYLFKILSYFLNRYGLNLMAY